MITTGLRVARGVFVAMALLTVALTVHMQAGGTVHPSTGGSVLIAAIFLVSIFASKYRWAFVPLLLAMLVTQFGFHIAFADSMNMDASQMGHAMPAPETALVSPMLVAHVLAAIGFAALLARLDQKLLELLRSTFDRYVRPLSILCHISSAPRPVWVLAPVPLKSQDVHSRVFVRGPPSV